MLGDSGEEMSHPGNMQLWNDISCQAEHLSHDTRLIHVDLARPHLYFDYPQVPERLAVAFPLVIWDWERYLGATGYCPAHDAVSETIDTIGIWEPVETILALQVLSTARPDQSMVDMGAQIGWFSKLASTQNVDSLAFDADMDCVHILKQNGITAQRCRIGVDEVSLDPDLPLRFAKLDLEGSERAAITALWPIVRRENLDHILMEVSPCFNDSYVDLLLRLYDTGYDIYALPPKAIPPHRLDSPADDLIEIYADDIENLVASSPQQDVWLKYGGAAW